MDHDAEPARYLALRRTTGDIELWTERDVEPGYGYGAKAPRRPLGSWSPNGEGGYTQVPPTPAEIEAYEAALAVYENPVLPPAREISFAKAVSKAGSLAKRVRRVTGSAATDLARLDAAIAALQAERTTIISDAWTTGESLSVEAVCALAETVSTKHGAGRATIDARLSPRWTRPGATVTSRAGPRPCRWPWSRCTCFLRATRPATSPVAASSS